MPIKFGVGNRRKSSANVLDSTPEPAAPAQSSFRVLERVEKINLNGQPQHNGARAPVQRPFNSPLASLRGRSAEELGATLNRGSGGTTNSGSSGYYESSSASARHSSSSTLPSSVDAEREPRDDELFPKKTKTAPMYRNQPSDFDDLPPPPKSFTSRAARALSFGQKHNRQGSITEINHVPPIPPAPSWPARSHSPQRDRALTTSSYASTAKPEPLTLGADFGSDFGNIFASSSQESPSPPLPVASQHKTDSQPIYPPRTVSRNFAPSKPSPDFLARERNNAGSPYSWDSRNSNEGLMTSSALSSPRLDSGPPVPQHKGGLASDFLRGPKAGYSLVPETQSPRLPPERLSQDSREAFISENDRESDDDEYASDKEADVRGVQLRDTQPSQSASSASFTSSSSTPSIPTRKPSGMPSQATLGASRAGAMSPDSSEGGGSLWGSESMTATPKAGRLNLPRHTEDSLFDTSPQGPPSRAIRPGTHTRTDSGTLKKMTKEQFERLQRGGDSSAEHSDDGHHSDDDYEDEDDAERAKKLAKQRQKQEANMSVYRQQMKKVTGGGPSDLPSSMPRPSLDRASASAPAVGGIHLGGMGGQPPPETMRGKQSDDDDDDVPLGILQAHGFPSGSRPPTRQEGDAANQRRASGAGSVMGGGAGQGNLPPFARRLPADPYFGSSLVNQNARESLGFSGAQSVYGGAPQQMQPQMQPQMGHPGGLVGVIAGEERAKAARRGSPNPVTGAFGNPMPLPQNMPQMPQMPRTMSMGNVTAPQTYTPSGTMPGMPQMPGMMPGMMPSMPGMPQMPQMQNQSQDQMQKFMEMQMQIMQNMLSMQQVQMGQTPQPQQQPTNDYLGVNFNQLGPQGLQQAAPSVNGGYTPSINQGRAMTMMNPPKGWDTPPAGLRPNSAMPATYAPSGYNIGGPAPGYSPSIAPSERSNVGMPSRYRPVETNGGMNNAGRSQSMTSSLTLQAYGNNTNRNLSPETRPQTSHANQAKSPTVRLIDKPKGAPKVSAKPVADDEDDEGWADMKKKRDDKKRFRFGKKSQTESTLGELYHGYD